MANTIKIRRSATQGATPTTAQLALGELAINTYDGKLFLKKDDGTESIVEVSGGGGGTSGGLEIRELTVKVSNSIFTIEDRPQANGQLISGATYTIDQSDSSNNNHPFALSTTPDGTHGGGVKYTTGWTYTGTAGTDGVGTFTVPYDVNRLYYYCENHPGMGGIIEIVHLYRTNLFDDKDTRFGFVERAESAASAEALASTFYSLNQLVKNDSGQTNDKFGKGTKISTNGEWLIAPEPWSDETQINAGAFYVYKKHAGSGWKVFHREAYPSGLSYFGAPVAISGDGRFVAASSLNNLEIRVYERNDVKGSYDLRKTITLFFGHSLAFSYDGKRLFIGNYFNNNNDGEVRLYEWVDYNRAFKLKGSITPPASAEKFGARLDVSRDGRSLAVTYFESYRFGIYDIDDDGVITEVQTTLLQNTAATNNAQFGRAFGVRMADSRQLIAFGNPYGFASGNGGVEIWTRAKSTYDPSDATSTFTHSYNVEEAAPVGGQIRLGHDIELSDDGTLLFAGDPVQASNAAANLLRNIKVFKIRGQSFEKLHEVFSSGLADDSGFAEEDSMSLSGDAETLIVGFPGKDAADVANGVDVGFFAEYRQQKIAAGFVTSTSIELLKNTNISGNVDITGEYRVNGVAISTGGGNVAVSDLTEVAAASPSNGDVIQYNGSTSLWEVASAPASGITVKQQQGPSGTVDLTANSVTEIIFDADTGFNVTDNTGSVFVSLGSSFKTWYVNGQSSLIAEGEDEIEFIAGTGVTLSTTTTHTGSASKALTINSTAANGADGAAATIQVGTVTTLAAGSSATITNSGTTAAAVFDFEIPAGAAGNPGTNGTDGTDATITVGTVSTGMAGSNATVINSGTASAAVLNFTIPQGDDGTAATITVGNVTTGAPGSSVTVTNTGSSNSAVFDFTIPQGDDGAATVSIGSVTTGNPGTNATVTNSGTQTAATLDFTIPKGDPGNPGTNGTDATISVGSVTTGAAGSSASVSNSGSASAAVLDFTIPKGDDGTPGTNGTDGTAATISVGSVTTLSAGSSVTVTNSGTTNAAVLDFGIPQGPDGAATVSIGTVTTGAAGTNASVTNSGTNTAAVLDFTIPRGDAGTGGGGGGGGVSDSTAIAYAIALS